MNVLTRRNVLAAACGTCAVAVAGCAAYGKKAPAPAPASADGAAPASSGLQTSQVPVGGGIIVADKAVVVTQPTKGTFKAFSAICTHQGCTVASVENGTINCPCHGSAFAVADGSVVNGPASQPLEAKKVTVAGTNITVS